MNIDAPQDVHNSVIENEEALPVDKEASTPGEPIDKLVDTAPDDNEPAEPEEVVVLIGDEELKDDDDYDEKDPNWTTQLRKRHKESQRELRELKEQLRAKDSQQVAAEPQIENIPKPTLESCEYDTERYEAKLEAWHENERKVREAKNKVEEKTKVERAAWQETINAYQKKKTELKVKDFDDAEGLVKESLSVTQQGILLQGAENSALLIYALGKNPKKAKELAGITDPVKFAFAIAKLETQLKVAPKKAPPPEQTLRGNSTPASSGASDSRMAALEAEAEKTGNRSKIIEYKRNLKNQSK